MHWAKVEGKKVEATPNKKGLCPSCEGAVFSRCGELNVHHWAHEKGESCDHWYEPETHWHLHWKLTFGKEHAEIVIKKNDKRHIADILTKNDVVIELQNSSIQKPVIRERETFYGEKMIWLINGSHFKDNFDIGIGGLHIYRHFEELKTDQDLPFHWKYARKSWSDVQRYVFIDFGDDSLFWVKSGMGTSSGKGKYVTKEKFINKYGGNYEYYIAHTTL